jgi:hypothetical protein
MVRVVVAALAAMVVGFIWNSPLLFERQWLSTVGVDPKDKPAVDRLKRSLGPFFLIITALVFVSAYVLSLFLSWLGAASALDGMRIAFLIWLGFGVPLVVGGILFGGTGRHVMWTRIWTDLLRHLVGFLAMGAILGGWR